VFGLLKLIPVNDANVGKAIYKASSAMWNLGTNSAFAIVKKSKVKLSP
jgi:hypothetical protein